MSKHIESTDAAAAIGCSLRTLQRLCAEHSIGSMFAGRLALTADDVEQVRSIFRGRPGNPKFGPGYHDARKAAAAKKARKTRAKPAQK